jgi:hypothetical protein
VYSHQGAVAYGRFAPEIHESAKFGVTTSGVSLDWDAPIKNKDGVVKQMTQGVSFLMKKNKVDVIMGAATLGDRRQRGSHGCRWRDRRRSPPKTRLLPPVPNTAKFPSRGDF